MKFHLPCVCIAGRPCVCERGRHTLHICSDPRCQCHSAAAYGDAQDKRSGQYVRALRLADVRKLGVRL